MRDGARLSATLHRPEGADRYPGILIANGYGEAVEGFLAETISLLVGHGYLVLCARMRGAPPSGGSSGLYERFGPDTYDLVEWLAAQGACNGRVGMFGASFLGFAQYLCAREAPPSLEVILPDDAGSDNYWYLWYPGGMSPGPGRAARQAVNGAENEYALALAHPNYDTFWRERTLQAADLAGIARRGVAVLLTSGWNSYLLGSTKSYEWLQAGSPGPRLKMIIGPWGHGEFMTADTSSAEPAILPYTGIEYAVMWLDRWLKDMHNGVDEEPRVLIYIQGPDQWRFERDWPLPDERQMRLYFREGPSKTDGGLNDGALAGCPPMRDKEVSYQYSPAGPYNVAAIVGISRPLIDKVPWETHGLAWTSEPFAVDTEITGYPRISFWAVISATDTDFVFEITDVGPTGGPGRLQSLQVTRGYLNAMRYFSRSDPRPLIPGRAYYFELELYPTAYVFRAGHRIRVTLQGSAIDPLAKLPAPPGMDPCLPVAIHGPGLNALSARVSVLHDEAHPSFVDLPVIGTGAI